MLLSKLKRFLKNPLRIFLRVLNGLSPFIKSDKLYLSLRYFILMGKPLHISSPKTYNEKLQWLKLYDRNPIYTSLVDKLKVKTIVSDLIGKEHVAKVYSVWDSPDDIDFSVLPEKFVIKTTHGGGNNGVFICKNKNSANLQLVKNKLKNAMGFDIYQSSREWPYKNVKKRIIAEEYLEDLKTGELRDYKFFCFEGKVKFLFVATDRQNRAEPFFNFFDRNYNVLDIKQGHPRNKDIPEKPIKFDEMILIAEKLSIGIPHVRVDLYEVNGMVYFGEFTFYHFGGFVPFDPPQWDLEFGNNILLPRR